MDTAKIGRQSDPAPTAPAASPSDNIVHLGARLRPVLSERSAELIAEADLFREELGDQIEFDPTDLAHRAKSRKWRITSPGAKTRKSRRGARLVLMWNVTGPAAAV